MASEFYNVFGEISLLSVWNEIQAMKLLKRVIQKSIDQYPTTLSEDYGILADRVNELSANQVQSIKAVIVEKNLFKWWEKFCDDIVGYWHKMDYGVTRAVAGQEPYNEYEAYFD